MVIITADILAPRTANFLPDGSQGPFSPAQPFKDGSMAQWDDHFFYDSTFHVVKFTHDDMLNIIFSNHKPDGLQNRPRSAIKA